MQKLMTSHLSDIQEVCKKRHVRNLYLFGSVLTNRFTDKSVDDAVIWGILVRHLPKLKIEIETLLAAS